MVTRLKLLNFMAVILVRGKEIKASPLFNMFCFVQATFFKYFFVVDPRPGEK